MAIWSIELMTTSVLFHLSKYKQVLGIRNHLGNNDLSVEIILIYNIHK